MITPGSQGSSSNRLYLPKLDSTTGALSVDEDFRDTDGNVGFSFAERAWPHRAARENRVSGQAHAALLYPAMPAAS